MIPETDTQFRESTIQRVEPDGDGWQIVCEDGWALFVPPVLPAPLVGDTARFYGKGIGYTVRGLSINGREVFYRTEEQQEAYARQKLAEADAKGA